MGPSEARWPRTATVPGLDARAVGDARSVLVDLDGCLVSEGRPFPDSITFAASIGERLWIVSNRSDVTAADLSTDLSELGLAMPPRRILLAGEVTLQALAYAEVARLSLWAGPRLLSAARDMGLDPRAARPEAIVLCRDPELTVDMFGQILSHVASGVPLWVSNEDTSHPDHAGRPVAETGALLAALRAIEPSLAWSCLGKPDPAMLHMALSRAGVATADAVFLGDNPATDGRAAASAGIRFLHVRRGRS